MAEHFRFDTKIADTMMSIPGVSDILKVSFSIDGAQFLGNGYSVPIGAKQYSDAKTHEYLIRNLCVTRNENENSPCRDDSAENHQFSTWVMRSEEIADNPNIKIGDLLTKVRSGSTNWQILQQHLKDDKRLRADPPLLIRFAKFPERFYLGTVGRSDATYVFFSNLAEVWDKSFFDAEADSGRIWVENTASDPGLKIFIWIFYPSAKDDAHLATWDYVIGRLESMKVDAEIAALAGDR
jgi:hypothetical protein